MGNSLEYVILRMPFISVTSALAFYQFGRFRPGLLPNFPGNSQIRALLIEIGYKTNIRLKINNHCMNQEYLKTCYHEHVFRGVEARVQIYDVNP